MGRRNWLLLAVLWLPLHNNCSFARSLRWKASRSIIDTWTSYTKQREDNSISASHCEQPRNKRQFEFKIAFVSFACDFYLFVFLEWSRRGTWKLSRNINSFIFEHREIWKRSWEVRSVCCWPHNRGEKNDKKNCLSLKELWRLKMQSGQVGIRLFLLIPAVIHGVRWVIIGDLMGECSMGGLWNRLLMLFVAWLIWAIKMYKLRYFNTFDSFEDLYCLWLGLLFSEFSRLQ